MFRQPGLSLLTCLLLTEACGHGPPPTVSIINPTNDATVPLGTDAQKSVSVAFATTNFTVMATCGGGTCGQVYVLIDGSACDPIGLTYNALAVSSPATAQFASCPTPTGAHVLALELHNPDGSPVKDSTGQTVSASVNVTTQ